MKVGTLTLHLPFNYGNALQMLSLHRHLLEQGHDAEVLDHWYFPKRAEVLCLHQRARTPKGLAHVLLDLLTFGGTFCQYRREAKLDAWLKANFRWSAETGATGEFDPARLPHDVVVVGSDQVWNPIHRTSDFFLLPDFPPRIRKVAYAASLGTDSFPPERQAFFAANLKRFAAVGVRESSAVRILREVADVPATLVCDPTLLHTADEWRGLLGIRPPAAVSSDLVFYFVTPDYRAHWREVVRLARSSGRRVHWFCFQWSQWLPSFDVRHPLRSLKLSAGNALRRLLLFRAGVRLHFAATPSEFVACLDRSEGLVTDSFHGLMFATIFGKTCNVVVGDHAERRQMSARLRDFIADFGNPEIMTGTPSFEAMRKVSITPPLQALVARSKEWLKEALASRKGF